MEDIPNKANVPIKVQFEYLNDNDILDLSKEYKINISLLENTTFEDNKEKIIKNANFKTPKERSYYHMFNKSKKKFLTQNSDFIPYIKTNSPVILINCYTYAEQILEKIKEESKNLSLSTENAATMKEIKKKEMTLVLSCLENNFLVDMFAEEFIFKNGIEYLIIIIKNNDGDTRMYALEGINKLLSFENAFVFFDKNKELLTILYNSFISNVDISCAYLFFDIIVKLIGGNEEKTMDVIEKIDENFYNKIISYLSEENKEDKIKSHTLLFINMVLNFSSPHKHFELVSKLTEAGIFEKLDTITKYKELTFLEQLNLFETSVEKILNETDKENENYKNIKDKFDVFVENKKIYHIQNLIKATKDEDENIKNDSISELNDSLKEKKYMDTFYESFMKNENLEIPFFDYIISLIESSKEKTMNFINSAKKYAEKKNSKTFMEIINYLSNETNENIRSHTLLFVNKILNFSIVNQNLELLLYFTESGIFDKLIKLLKCKDELFLEQIKTFETTTEQILEKLNKEEDNYKLINNKYKTYQETKIYNQIKDLVLKQHNNIGEFQTKVNTELVNLITEKKAYSILYEVFMDNNNNNLAYSFFDVFVKIFGSNKENNNLFIDIARKYAEKNNSVIFNKLIYYISEKNTNDMIKSQAMQIINLIINFSKDDVQYELLVQFTKIGIFDKLDKLIKKKDGSIMAQLKLLLNTIKSILKNANKEDENYQNINENYKKIKENKKFYEKTMDDFVVVDDDF